MSAKSKSPLPILAFRSIPGVHDGETMLTVNPPDDDRKLFSAWVGGCCVGTSNHMDIACELLLERAKATCQRHVDEADRIRAHYIAELNRLHKEGLTSR